MLQTGAADHNRILAKAREWAGAPMALATVIETWRSAPCPVGTHMLIHVDGQFIGSVSGGCVEGDVLHVASEVIGGAPATVRRYGVADGAAWEVGLPCGGNIAVLVQPVTANGFPPALFERIASANTAGETLHIGTDLTSGLSDVLAQRSEDQFLNIYAPPKRLLIIGAVEIAATLSAIAQRTGLSVDDTLKYLSDHLPGAAKSHSFATPPTGMRRGDARGGGCGVAMGAGSMNGRTGTSRAASWSSR